MMFQLWSRSAGFVVLLGLVGIACSPASSGGSGGQTGSGGDSGSGGANPNCVNNPDDLIADFKSDTGVAQLDGRVGGFYTYGDDSEKSGSPLAVLDPAEGTAASTDPSVQGECASKAPQ